MKSKIGRIVAYTVEKNIRNKWFVILNIVMLLGMLITFNFGTVKQILEVHHVNIEKPIHIIVESDKEMIASNIEAQLKNSVKDTAYQLEYHTQLQSYDKDSIDLNTVVVQAQITENAVLQAKIISQEGIKTEITNPIVQGLENSKEELFALQHNMTPQEMRVLQEEVKVDRITLGVDNKNAEAKQGVQTICNYFILIALLMILSKIANDISQEKISKSIEYVLTSISAKGYLVAKVISVNLTLIIQLIFTFVYFMIGMFSNSVLNLYVLQNSGAAGITSGIDTGMLLGMLGGTQFQYVALLLGYLVATVLIASVIQAVLSSKTTNIDEAGNATILLITINLVLYVLSTLMITPLKSPSILLYIVSCIPGISLYFIPTMVLLGQATILQVVVATSLLGVAIPVVFHFGAKWFKNGVLDYSNNKRKKKEKAQEINILEKQKVLKKEYSKIGFVIGFSVILFVVLQFGFGFLSSVLAPPITNLFGGRITLEQMMMIGTCITSVLSLCIPALFVIQYLPKNGKADKKVSIQSCVTYIFMALPLIVLIQIIVGYLLEKLGINYDIVAKLNMLKDSSTFTYILFFIQLVVLPAIFEEIFVRKALLNYLKQYGVGFAIIVSSLLFAVVHMNISQSIFAFLMGIILATIAVKTGSILPTILLHFLNNGYAALITIFEGNTKALLGINIGYFVLIAIGVVVLLVSIFKESSNLFGLKNEKKNKREQGTYKRYRYIAWDYSFVIACILIVVVLLVTEKILRIG